MARFRTQLGFDRNPETNKAIKGLTGSRFEPNYAIQSFRAIAAELSGNPFRFSDLRKSQASTKAPRWKYRKKAGQRMATRLASHSDGTEKLTTENRCASIYSCTHIVRT